MVKWMGESTHEIVDKSYWSFCQTWEVARSLPEMIAIVIVIVIVISNYSFTSIARGMSEWRKEYKFSL